MAQTKPGLDPRADPSEEDGPPPGGLPPAAKTARRSWLERIRDFRDGLARATLDNPVLIKEFRTRMRGPRAYWVLLTYTLFLGGVLAMMYFGFEASMSYQSESLGGTQNAEHARNLGRSIYYFVFIAQSIMVALITPALTAGQVTLEREQRSYELLVTTPLRPVDIIRGKLTAAVSFVVLLLTSSLPLVSLTFLVGGVSPAEIFFSYLIIALSAFVYGALGIFWSATLRTTSAATVVTYLSVLSIFILSSIPGSMAGSGVGNTDVPFRSLNPISACFHAVQNEHLFNIQAPSWVSAAVLLLLAGMLIGNAAMARLEHFEPPWPLWTRLLSTLIWCAFTISLLGPLMGGAAKSWNSATTVNEWTGALLITVLILSSLVTPILNTGDLVVRRGESAVRRYLSGFAPVRAFRDDLACGMPLAMSWLLFALALVAAGIWLAGKSKLFHPADTFLPGAVLCVSVITGLAGVGHLLSVVLPSRWAACVLTYLFGVVVMLLAWFPRQYWGQATTHENRGPDLLGQVLYLVPFEALVQLGNPKGFWINHPEMLFGRSVPLWVVTSAIYLCLAAGCFLITALRIDREGKMLQQSPCP